MYMMGNGVVQDKIKAHMWWNFAAMKGDSEAARKRDIIAAKMTLEQVTEAQKLARECQERNFKNCE
jgi:TPR repeat protein